jgi:hypothetical protein|tara:strand:- start:902 stop:1327 length:426 start_codon:yes stop_codon:yes gene_type:complete
MYVDDVWDKAAPFLQRAIDVTRGKHNIETLYEEIKTGKEHLWAFYNEEDEMVGSLTTEFTYYPLRVNLSVAFLGSDDCSFSSEDWVATLGPLEEFGKLYGCSALEITGRRAWARYFKDSGFVETFTTVEREIDHGKKVSEE